VNSPITHRLNRSPTQSLNHTHTHTHNRYTHENSRVMWFKKMTCSETECGWSGTAERANVMESLLKTGSLIANSGWDHVLSAYVSLGFLLLDHRNPSGPFARSKSAIAAAQAVHRCAYELLTKSFVNQRECRGTVLDGILSRVMSNNANTSVVLLRRLVSEQTTIVVSMHEHFKESLEYLPLLPMKIAVSFLEAVTPLLQSRSAISLRNYAAIVFRKAIFRRELSSRVVAVQGMLALATEAETMSSSSSSNSATVAKSRREQWQQINGLLRRALTQQFEVRDVVYKCLGHVFKKDKHLRIVVGSQLLDRLNHYVTSSVASEGKQNDDEDEEEDPLSLNDCISRLGTPKITEPLDILIGVLVSCCEHEIEDVTDVESICEALDDLTQETIKRDDVVDWKFNSKMTYVLLLLFLLVVC